MSVADLRERIYSAFTKRARRVSVAETTIEILLVLGGSFFAAVFALFSDGFTWPWSISQIGGVVAGVLAFVGGCLVIFFRGSDVADLNDAREALDIAYEEINATNDIYDQALAYEEANEELKALYFAYVIARGTIERAIAGGYHDETKLIQACLAASGRSLKLSLGFQLHHFWTICVYRAGVDRGDGKTYLTCIAHDRQIPCELNEARKWGEGVGVGGIAYAKNDEVVVPDLLDPAVGTAFRLEEAMMKEEDKTRYRSLFAVPVTVGHDKKPWGVVLATSNDPTHFGGGYREGVQPEESVRALAGMVALAVAVCRSNHGLSEQKSGE